MDPLQQQWQQQLQRDDAGCGSAATRLHDCVAGECADARGDALQLVRAAMCAGSDWLKRPVCAAIASTALTASSQVVCLPRVSAVDLQRCHSLKPVLLSMSHVTHLATHTSHTNTHCTGKSRLLQMSSQYKCQWTATQAGRKSGETLQMHYLFGSSSSSSYKCFSS